ncbi:MAG TPA: hypothetical protein VGE62_00585 [Candidatus Paceibacterota bacterium]
MTDPLTQRLALSNRRKMHGGIEEPDPRDTYVRPGSSVHIIRPDDGTEGKKGGKKKGDKKKK